MTTTLDLIERELAEREQATSQHKQDLIQELRSAIAAAVQSSSEPNPSRMVEILQELGRGKQFFAEARGNCNRRWAGMQAEQQFPEVERQYFEISRTINEHNPAIEIAKAAVEAGWEELIDDHSNRFQTGISLRHSTTKADLRRMRELEFKHRDLEDDQSLRSIERFQLKMKLRELRNLMLAGVEAKDPSCDLEAPADFRLPE